MKRYSTTDQNGVGQIGNDATSSYKGQLQLAGDLGGTAASPQVLSTHLTSALPVLQGGTGTTTSIGSGSVVLSNSPTLTTPNIGAATAGGDFTLSTHNLVTDTTTGSKIGTATNQKLGFFNATPIVQPSGDALTALSNLGLVSSPTLNESDITNLTSDLAARALDSSVVHLAGSETITGAKIFNLGSLLDKGNQVFNVKAFGAVLDGITNDQPAFQNCANAMTNGGVFYIPQGTPLLNSHVIFKYNGCTVEGAGVNATTVICNFSSTSDGVFYKYNNGTTPVSDFTLSNLSVNLNHNKTGAFYMKGTDTLTTSRGLTFKSLDIYGKAPDTTGSMGAITINTDYAGVLGQLSGVLFKDVYIHDGDATDSTNNCNFSICILSNSLSDVEFDNVSFYNTFSDTIHLGAQTSQTRKNWRFNNPNFKTTKQLYFSAQGSVSDINDTTRSGFMGIKILGGSFDDSAVGWVRADDAFCMNIYNSRDFIVSGTHFKKVRSVIAPGLSSPSLDESQAWTFENCIIDDSIEFIDPDGHLAGTYTGNVFRNIAEGSLLGGYGTHAPSVYDGNEFINCGYNISGTNEFYKGIFLIEDGGNVIQNNTIYNDNVLTTPGAPTVAVNAVAGNLNGTYLYKVTFVTQTGAETSGGTTSASVSPANQKVNLTAIPTGPAGTYYRKIYRTPAGGADGTQKFVASILDNTTTTYTDNIADSALGAAVPTTNGTTNMLSYVFCELYGGPTARTTYPNIYKNNTVIGSGGSVKTFYLDSAFAHVIQGNSGLTESTIQNSLASGSPSVTALASTDVASRNWQANGTLVTENSPLPISSGGTGQTTKSAAFNTLSPMTTAGDFIYGGASGAGTRLAAGTLSQVLIGGTTPSWGAVALGSMVSGTLGVTNGGSGTSTSFTQGSVIFAGASGVYSQDNTKLFWDDTNFRLGIGTGAPLSSLDVVGSGPSIYLRYTSTPTSSARIFADSFNLSFQSNSGTDTSPTWTTGLKLGLSGSGIGTGNASLPTANATLYLGATNSGYFVIERGQTAGGSSTDLYIGESNDTGHFYVRGTNGITLSNGPLNINAQNIVTDTTTGSKIGTATNQKLGFFNATPIVQPSGDVITALQNLGLVASATISESDVTNLTTDLAAKAPTASPTFTGTLTAAIITASKAFTSGVVALTDGATIATDASLGNLFTVTIAGNRTMSNPTNLVDGIKYIYRIKQDATGGRTITWDTNFRFSTDNPAPTLSTTASKTDYYAFIYNGTDGKIDYLGAIRGF